MDTKYALFGHLSLLLLLGCGKVPTAEPNQPFTHFVADFESGNLENFHALTVDPAVNTVVVAHPVRKGNYALKNTMRPDDYIFNGYRSELSVYNCAKYKTEVYYAFSFMIDSGYSDPAFNLICQWQDLPYYIQGETWEPNPNLRGSSPPMALVYVDGNLELKMNENPTSDKDTYLVGTPQPIQKGVWYDIIAHVYWSDDQTAYTEVSINGTYITPANGADHKFYRPNLFNRTGNYFKFGHYRGKDKPQHTNIIYFDELKIGSSLEEVML